MGTPVLSAPVRWFETVEGRRGEPVHTPGSGPQRAECGDDLVSLGKTLFVLLGEHEGSLGLHVELAAAAFHHVDIDPECLLNGGRQTGGLGQVVSNLAVLDGNPHAEIVPQPTTDSQSGHLIAVCRCASLSRRAMQTSIGDIRGVLLDLDGTVYEERGLIDGADRAVARLRAAGLKLRFATNTSRHPRGALVERLRSLGVDARADEVVTAPRAAAAWLCGRALSRISLHVAPAIVEEFSGFTLDEHEPEAVVLGDLGDEWTVDRLNRVFRHLLGGAVLLAIQKNRYWRRGGALCLDAGPFVAALEFATGVTAEVAGKPSPAFFGAAAESMGVPLEQLVVVGDDLRADVRGAEAAGAKGVLVKTGKFEPSDLDAEDGPPANVTSTLAELPVTLGL